jgi:putative hemolysin
MEILTEIIVILCLVLLNGFLSMSEMAVVSSRKARLKKRADDGSLAYKVAYETAEKPRRFLSTIQIGITLVGVLAGAIGGATIATVLREAFADIPWLADWANGLSFAIVVSATTLLSVVFGELVPKSVALASPEKIAAFVSLPMRVIGAIFRPIVWFLTFLTELVLKIFRLGKTDEPSVTEEEVKALLEQGAEIGVFEKSEHDMVENILYLGDKRASAFMTHRMDIAWIPEDATRDMALEIVAANPQLEMYPVCRNGLDDAVGMIGGRKLLVAIAQGSFTCVRELMEPPLMLPESLNAIKTLAAMRAKDARAALIMDEYGGVEGLVCIRDLSYEILGEAEQASTLHEAEVAEREDGSWLVEGMMALDDFHEFIGLRPDESSERHNTVAGLVLDLMGRIPSKGDYVDWRGYRIEVVDMDGHRIDQLLVKKKIA